MKCDLFKNRTITTQNFCAFCINATEFYITDICKRFINISSQAVYSGIADTAPSENDTTSPYDLYGIMKLETEGNMYSDN